VLALVLIQTAFVVGLGLMFSVLNVYFRDVQHFMGILLQLWFYGTPIVYPLTVVPERVRFAYSLNPMVQFVEAYRDCLYDLRMPPLLHWVYLIVVSVVTLAVGWAIFVKLEPKLAEEM
jgi:ABC-2 type transport system permease protein